MRTCSLLNGMPGVPKIIVVQLTAQNEAVRLSETGKILIFNSTQRDKGTECAQDETIKLMNIQKFSGTQ